MKYSDFPVHKNIVISKNNLPRLPKEFERTVLGYPKEGSIAQYRGPNATHVHEYVTHWRVHRDIGDPRTLEGAILHLIYDAPEIALSIAVAGISGTVVGKTAYELRKDDSNDAVTEAIIAGGIASVFFGLLTFLLLRRK